MNSTPKYGFNETLLIRDRLRKVENITYADGSWWYQIIRIVHPYTKVSEWVLENEIEDQKWF